MIYTVTLNPSLDYTMHLEQLKTGATNRTENCRLEPGGKGLNVSMMLHHLGNESTALGFVAGFTGEKICSCIRNMGIKEELIHLKSGDSRINVKLVSGSEDALTETEINAPGPVVDKEACDRLFEKLERLTGEDMLVLSGNVPAGMDTDIYARIMQHVRKSAGLRIRIIVDTSGQALSAAIAEKPFLVKPNIKELEEEAGFKASDGVALREACVKLQQKGAGHVMVSMGREGAFFLEKNGNGRFETAPEGKLVSSVGSGDCMVAGFISMLEKGDDLMRAFSYGVCAGSASAFVEHFALRWQVDELFGKMR